MTSVNYDKIKGLVYTEKSNKILEGGKYCFEIDKNCTKSEIKTLIKSVFNVDAEKVNIINTSGKVKRFKGIIGTRKAYKKAIVTIKKGQTINFQELK